MIQILSGLRVRFRFKPITFRLSWLLVILVLWTGTGCALRDQPRDLATYLNRDIYAIAELEKVALRRYDERTGERYVSDQALRASLVDEIIPAYERFVELAGQIQPRTKPVMELHVLYRKAAALRLRGFQTVLLAVESQDPALVRQANTMLRHGQSFVAQWQAQMSVLAQKNGLELK